MTIDEAIKNGDFTLAKKLLKELENENRQWKKGRISNKEIEQIRELSQSMTVEEISDELNRKPEIVKKYYIQQTKKQNFTRQTNAVQFTGNTFKDDGKSAKGKLETKKINDALYGGVTPTERRPAPKKITSRCIDCGKTEQIFAELAMHDPEKRTIYHHCKHCLKKGEPTR